MFKIEIGKIQFGFDFYLLFKWIVSGPDRSGCDKKGDCHLSIHMNVLYKITKKAIETQFFYR